MGVNPLTAALMMNNNNMAGMNNMMRNQAAGFSDDEDEEVPMQLQQQLWSLAWTVFSQLFIVVTCAALGGPRSVVFFVSMCFLGGAYAKRCI